MTKSRAVRAVAGTALVVGAVVWATGMPAAAARRQLVFASRLWVGSSPASQIAGQVRPDLQLGLNFGVDLTGADQTTTTDSLLSLDMSQVAAMVTVTGLTKACDPTPTLITCHMNPTDPSTLSQSMTLTATAGVPAGTTGTIKLSTSWPDDTDPTDDAATIELTVIIPAQAGSPQDATQAATPPPNAQSQPVVIAPLPTITTAQQPNVPLASPTPKVTLTPTLARVPQALGTRRPGFIQIGPDGKRHVAYAGEAPEDRAAAAVLSSPVFLMALGASSLGLIAIIVFGVVNARRATRPATRPLRASDPTRPSTPIRPSTPNRRNIPNRSNEPTRPDRHVHR